MKSEYRLLGIGDSVLSGCAFPAVLQRETFMLLFIRSGTGRLMRNGLTHDVSAGNLLFLYFGFSYSLCVKDGPLSCTTLLIRGDPGGLPAFCLLPHGSEAERQLGRLAKGGVQSGGLPALDLLMTSLRAGCAFGRDPPPGYLSRLKNIIDGRYSERLSLNVFAEELHVNKFKLAKEFKSRFGVSPIEYLIDRRIQEAGRLLLGTGDSVAGIGSAVGMDNTPYFIRTFKRRTGCTPGAYRRILRKPEGEKPEPEKE